MSLDAQFVNLGYCFLRKNDSAVLDFYNRHPPFYQIDESAELVKQNTSIQHHAELKSIAVNCVGAFIFLCYIITNT